MSDKDIEEINKRYKCGNTGGGNKGKFIFDCLKRTTYDKYLNVFVNH